MIKIIIFPLLFAILYMSSLSWAGIHGYAGVDFSMLGEDVYVPVFISRSHAFEYANRLRWNHKVMDILYKRISDYDYDSHQYVMFSKNSAENIYKDQRDWTVLAVNIMQQWKKTGVKEGDPAMFGAVIYAGEEPVKGWR